MPVYAGAGGSVAQAKIFAKAAAEAGADGLLLLPPYLVDHAAGRAWSTTPARSPAPPTCRVIVYNRGNARYTEASAVEVAHIPNVVGFKDGTGDVDLVARIVRAVTDALEPSASRSSSSTACRPPRCRSRPTARSACTLYSSATFAFAPELALAFYDALERGDEALIAALLREFFHPLVRLRDTVPGYAVSLIKAGVTHGGHRRRTGSARR